MITRVIFLNSFLSSKIVYESQAWHPSHLKMIKISVVCIHCFRWLKMIKNGFRWMNPLPLKMILDQTLQIGATQSQIALPNHMIDITWPLPKITTIKWMLHVNRRGMNYIVMVLTFDTTKIKSFEKKHPSILAIVITVVLKCLI